MESPAVAEDVPKQTERMNRKGKAGPCPVNFPFVPAVSLKIEEDMRYRAPVPIAAITMFWDPRQNSG